MAADYPPTDLTREVGDFLEELAKLEIEDIEEVPAVTIPGWPSEAEVTIDLGKRSYLFPTRDPENGLRRYEQRTNSVIVEISHSGAITVKVVTGLVDRVVKGYSSNKSWNGAERAVALLLFQQFAGEILPVVIQKLKEGLPAHNRVLADARNALDVMRKLGFVKEE